jgi:Resolvase, N terminal domain
MHKRAAIYVRVSADRQTVENQLRELRQIAERRGWEVVKEYNDAGISGSKGRNGRPGLDEMLKDAQRQDRPRPGKTNPESITGRQGHVGDCQGVQSWHWYGPAHCTGNGSCSPFRRRKRGRVKASTLS